MRLKHECEKCNDHVSEAGNMVKEKDQEVKISFIPKVPFTEEEKKILANLVQAVTEFMQHRGDAHVSIMLDTPAGVKNFTQGKGDRICVFELVGHALTLAGIEEPRVWELLGKWRKEDDLDCNCKHE